jgi:eukaryotic-like serine/threonine-protein kinase
VREATPEFGAEPVSNDRRRRLAQLRDILEIGWEAGLRPRAEDLLASEAEADRIDLLPKLLEIELVVRQVHGEQAAPEELLARLPENADLVRQVLSIFARRDDDETSGVTADPKTPLPVSLGRYRVLGKLGEGGFGVVYLAYDDDLLRPVAIKVPHRHRVSGPGDIEGYLNEARVLACLEHPNIVPVHDVGRTADGLPYVVSKLVEGCNLSARLRQGLPSFGESAALVAAVADALHHSHLRGLVHRDVKPANILLDKAAKPYVADFGLALREEDFGKGPRAAGTPAYMSPEQARGEGHRVDGRSDIFSLGIVFYELLTARRPFRAESVTELLDQVATADPRPPRQVDDSIPKELERICLKALSKHASQRYSTARDMADDLRFFLGAGVVAAASSPPRTSPLNGQPAPPTPVTPALPPQAQVVPKGLRPFDASDTDFFLDLLPGPRDREGLPESLRFWKTRIEESDPDQTFQVGLMYGPSGCGKSSLAKAGLLPRLAGRVTAVYVECTGAGTEARLLKRLRKLCPQLGEGESLPEAVAALRRGVAAESGRKILIVLDQFEQWLHAGPADGASELVQALRQCDGGRVQCLLLVRDDFWMAATRFLRELEVLLLEGETCAAVDLFDARHAKNVLTLFGQAFAAVPGRDEELSDEHKGFLDQAVAGLSDDGHVIPVRLAVFAEMVKAQPWRPATLRSLGGMAGIGVTFLEQAFAAPSAPPRHRLHQRAVRATLKALLPPEGTDIKGNRLSRQQLMEASGYAGRPNDFEDLLQILARELRLVSPSDSEGAESESGQGQGGGPSYQLTHDYLVPSLREWLARKQKETRRGRAELRLEERAALWGGRPENRNLPSWWEWTRIGLLTRRRDWTPPQREMMRRASRYHLARGVALAFVLALLGWGAWEYHGLMKGHALRDRLQDAATADVPDVVADLGPYRRWADPLLREALARAEAKDDTKRQLRFSLALPSDPGQADYLYGRLFDVEPGEFGVVRSALLPGKDACTERLWSELAGEDGDLGRRFRAACALASYAPEDPRWSRYGKDAAARLVGENPLVLVHWKDALYPARKHLMPHLAAFLGEAGREDAQRRTIAGLYREYAEGRPEAFASLAEQLTVAAGQQAPKPWKPGEAKRLAGIAAGLVAMGEAERVWPHLKHSPDPTVRGYLIASLGKVADPGPLVDRLSREPEASIRRAILLALGGFGRQRLLDTDRDRLVPMLLRLYRDDPDPGVHSAAEWVLRSWNRTGELEKARQQLATGQPEGGRRWFINNEKQTLAIVPGKAMFWLIDGKTRRWRSLGRDVGVATREVTVAEFRRLRNDHKYDTTFAPTRDHPVNSVSFYDAAEYCNWLSEQDGIPETEWCYKKNKEGKYAEGMKMAADFLTLKGYRLPTEAEWEAAASAGAMTRWSCGEADNDLLVEYAWYHYNSCDANSVPKCSPVGQVKPNDLGLFDMHGNLYEWSNDDSTNFHARMGIPTPKDANPPSIVLNDVTRMIRGGSLYDRSHGVGSDVAIAHAPAIPLKGIGFRVVRTNQPPELRK